ncbi:MAG TPA: hypothetical protein VMR81_03270 [Patescibacteria group bacterium]|nr:hypothetical protein [Patescibacteria group bacterium]
MKLSFQSADRLTSWKVVKKNWVIQLATKFIFFFLAASIAAIIWRWPILPPLVPLWYSRPWGADQLAQPVWIFILPLGALCIYLINLLISIYVMSEYLIFTQVLFLSSFLINLLSFIAVIKVLFLVT